MSWGKNDRIYSGSPQCVDDLHKLNIVDEGNGTPLSDHKATSHDGRTKALFRNLDAEIIARINACDAVFGCVAWLTHFGILRALAKKKRVSLVVQKEDFLRPDTSPHSNWRKALRAHYDAIPGTSRYSGGPEKISSYGALSYCGDDRVQAVRCVGNHNRNNKPAFPRAHHKFVLFCKLGPLEYSDSERYPIPYEVWTGSFNFTDNATKSFENVIVSKDANLIEAYAHEYAQILALSEPLNWEDDWCAPEWRIGS